jgi:predicted TIM-barrel enzyme
VYTILLLTEDSIHEHDAARISQLHDDDEVEVHVLVPADMKHRSDSAQSADEDAMHAVNATIDRLADAGLAARGAVTAEDPVPAAVEAARHFDVDEVVVVTPPHPVREALHRDWSSRLRDDLQLPLLHFVTGTDQVVS